MCFKRNEYFFFFFKIINTISMIICTVFHLNSVLKSKGTTFWHSSEIIFVRKRKETGMCFYSEPMKPNGIFDFLLKSESLSKITVTVGFWDTNFQRGKARKRKHVVYCFIWSKYKHFNWFLLFLQNNVKTFKHVLWLKTRFSVFRTF